MIGPLAQGWIGIEHVSADHGDRHIFRVAVPLERHFELAGYGALKFAEGAAGVDAQFGGQMFELLRHQVAAAARAVVQKETVLGEQAVAGDQTVEAGGQAADPTL